MKQLLAAVLFFGSLAAAQPLSNLTFVTTDPSGACGTGNPNQQNNITTGTQWVCKNGTWTAISGSGGPPTGAAGGDLSGTYPNPSVNGFSGVPFCTGFTPITGQLLVFSTSSSPNPCWSAVNGLVAGTTGGIPYWNGSAVAWTPTLTSQCILTGGGAGAGPSCTPATIDGSVNATGFNMLNASAFTVLNPNAGTTGTTLNKLAKIDSSGNSVIATTSDTAIPVYCVLSASATTGNAILAVGGVPSCLTDAGGATAGHYLVASTTTGGTLHDAGAAQPPGVFIVGQAQTTVAANTAVGFLVQGIQAVQLFPEVRQIQFANCVGLAPGSGVSIGVANVPVCRQGTNNLGGYVGITDAANTFAQFQVSIPLDWNTATNPYIRLAFISVSDTTNGHTVIPEVAVSCPTATNGTSTDDVTLSAYQSLSTVTFASGVVNGFYTSSVQFGSTQMSGCVAGGFMIVSVGRATDTATGVIGFEYANITFPRSLTVGPN